MTGKSRVVTVGGLVILLSKQLGTNRGKVTRANPIGYKIRQGEVLLDTSLSNICCVCPGRRGQELNKLQIGAFICEAEIIGSVSISIYIGFAPRGVRPTVGLQIFSLVLSFITSHVLYSVPI